MEDQKIEVKKIVKKYARVLQAEGYPVSAVYLFGSFAKGTQHEWSDIDVAVVSEQVGKNREEGRMNLWRARRNVDSRIEPHGFSPKAFSEDWQPMVHEIKTTGIRIYP